MAGGLSGEVFLNGRYVPYEEARVPVEDRGFLFGDGIYEVIKIYRGRPFRLRDHLARLERSAREILLELPDVDWGGVVERLVRGGGLADRDATVYIEVSRGSGPRAHHFPPAGTPPTVLALARELPGVSPEFRERGATAITHPDLRWARCDIKSVNLLPNVLAKEKAVRAGAYEAILVRDGVAIEGSSSNFFAVLDGAVVTHPEGPHILSGVTRAAVLGLARDLGYQVVEAPILVADLRRASELFVTSTTAEVMPIVRVDGEPVGDGRPGPVARKLCEAFLRLV